MLVSYAQNFEDVLLLRALAHVENGFYIDLGAQDPLVDSVSQAFHERGWRGIHVEPTPNYAQLLREQRPGDTVIQAAVANGPEVLVFFEVPGTGISTADPKIAESHREKGFEIREITVPCVRLSSILKMCSSQEVHWMKIDVEGYERTVLSSWGRVTVRPWIVVVESTLPLTQIESHQSWEHLLLRKGYEFVYFDGLNRYYVSADRPQLKVAFRAPPNVFDNFAMSGTGSSPIHAGVRSKLDNEIAKVVSDHERRVQLALGETYELKRQTSIRDSEHEEQLRASLVQIETLRNSFVARADAHAERERVLSEQANELHAKLESSLQLIAKREREYSDQRAAILIEAGQKLEELRLQLFAEKAELVLHHQAEIQRLVQDRAAREALFAATTKSHEQSIDVLRSELKQLAESIRAAESEYSTELKVREEEIKSLVASLHTQQNRIIELENINEATHMQTQALIERQQNQLVALSSEVARAQSRLGEEISRFSTADALARSDIAKLMSAEARLQAEANQLASALSAQQTKNAQLHEQIGAFGEEVAPQLAGIKSLGLALERNSRLACFSLAPNSEGLAVRTHLKAHEVTMSYRSTDEDVTEWCRSARHSIATIETLLAHEGREFLDLAYVATLGRSIDESGRAFYLQRLASGVHPMQVLEELATSDESMAAGCISVAMRDAICAANVVGLGEFGHLCSHPVPRAQELENLLEKDGARFVFQAYFSILGRPPDPNGLGYYLPRLRGGVSKFRIAVELALSSEAVADQSSELIRRLATAVKRYKRVNYSILGPVLRFVSVSDIKGERKSKSRNDIRRLEQCAYALSIVALHTRTKLGDLFAVGRQSGNETDVVEVEIPNMATRLKGIDASIQKLRQPVVADGQMSASDSSEAIRGKNVDSTADGVPPTDKSIEATSALRDPAYFVITPRARRIFDSIAAQRTAGSESP
jgi:FkbM family methyltransferase